MTSPIGIPIDNADTTVTTAELRVTRINAASDAVSSAASAWVLADRMADAKADELGELEARCEGRGQDGERLTDDQIFAALAARPDAVRAYRVACELEQDRDQRWRAAARAFVKTLEGQ